MSLPESKQGMTWRDKLRFIINMDFSSFIKSFIMRRKDRWFDKKYGTDTWSMYKLPESKAEKDLNWPYSLYSQSSLIKPFQLLMEDLITSQVIPQNVVFLDVGCGKGLIILLSTSFGFNRIIGIEKSQEICKITRQNVEIFKKRAEQPVNIEIVECDASAYSIPEDVNVICLCNPFNGRIMRDFMNNVCESLHRKWRPIIIIYSLPEYHKIIEQTGAFEVIKKEFFDPVPSLIFRTK